MILLAVLVTGCASPAGSGASAGQVTAGTPEPSLAGTTLDGTALDLRSLKGRPVIVNFWASWCVPCRDEFPLFKDQLAAHAGDGLAIVGVLFNDDPGSARSFVTKFGATWPSLVDPDRGHANTWIVVAPPQSYFIGRDGVIRSRQIGEVTADDFQRQLAAILQ